MSVRPLLKKVWLHRWKNVPFRNEREAFSICRRLESFYNTRGSIEKSIFKSMRRSVYIETTIPSYYFETRKDVKSVAWRQITREWWRNYRRYYDALISEMVIFELERGSHPVQHKKVFLMRNIERLSYLPVIDDIVETYIGHKLMPREFAGDGYHLAFAS